MNNETNEAPKTLPMPHLHRRHPLRQPVPPRRGILLPPHPPENPSRTPPNGQSRRASRPAAPEDSLRHPELHRPGPPAHSRQPDRPPTSRPAPLRPPDRQLKPPQTRTQHTHRQLPKIPPGIFSEIPRTGSSRRDHHSIPSEIAPSPPSSIRPTRLPPPQERNATLLLMFS